MGSIPLLLVWLVLAMCPSFTICAMGATQMFADCTNIDSSFTNSGGGDFEAIGCNYPPTETVVSLGWGAGTTATVCIAYGKVAAGASASLTVQCPPTVISHSLRVTVTGIAFGQDASFRFTGALPPRSSLHISNNTFLLTQQNRNTFTTDQGYYDSSNFTSAILIGDWATALVLEEGTAMSALNNTVTCRWTVGSEGKLSTESVVAVNVIGASATLLSMATLSVSGNSIVNSTYSDTHRDAYVAYLYIYSSSTSITLTLSSQSAITMSGNSVASSSFRGNVYVANLYLYSYNSSSTSNLSLSNQSNIAMSGNSIASSNGQSIYVAYLYLCSNYGTSSLSLSNQSDIAMSGNSIANSSVSSGAYEFVAYLLLYSGYGMSSSLSQSSQSTIAMSGNSIANNRLSHIAFAAYLDLYQSVVFLSNQSAITMSGNSIANSSISYRAFAADLNFHGYGLRLSNQSTITMSGNSIANSFSGYVYVANLYLESYLGSIISLSLSNGSAITMSGNSIANSSSYDVYVAYLCIYSTSITSITLTLSNQSVIAMSGNSIANSSSFRRDAIVAYLFLFSSNSLALSNQSAITMSGNSFVNSSFSYVYDSGRAYVAYLYFFSNGGSSSSTNISLFNQSAITMSYNSIGNSSSFSRDAYAAYMYLHSYSSSSITLTLSNQSAITMSGNNYAQISSESVSLVIIQVTGLISLKGMASLNIDGNNAYATYSPSAALLSALLISACNISLSDSSRISATGNILQAPFGQSGQLASVLTISSSSASGVLSLSGNSSLVVALNDIIADAMAVNVTMKVSAEFPSTIAIVGNHISGGYTGKLANFSRFYLNGEIIASGNLVGAPSHVANFSLVTVASTFTNGIMASVQACGNYLSWVGHVKDAKLYLQPTAFASLAAQCPTETLALLASQSVSSSASVLAAGSLSPTSQSNTSDETKSLTLVDIPDTTHGVLSTVSATSPPNCSIGDICQLVKVASDQSALFDTCTEPEPTANATKNSTYVPLARYIGNAAKQAAVQSSYQGPALSGNAFYYGSVGVQLPEGMANVTHVAAASPAIAACWVYARNANETEIRFAVEALPVAAGTLDSESVPVVLMDLSLKASCGAATIVFNRTIAMERPVVYMPKKVFVSEKAVHDAATITGALSVTVGAVAVPIAAMQQGVALALLRMAQCEEDALNGEPLDVSVHPLQFGVGGGAGKYGRGALLGNLLVIPAVWCALLYLLVPLAIRALTGRTLDVSRDFVGWPGMALMPLAVLSEGSAMASVGLLAQGSAGDIIMGVVGLAILLVTTACWAAELRRMRRQIQLRRASSVASWVKAVHPRFEWERGGKTDVANSSYLDKRIQLLSSSWWLWSALVAQLLSIVVGVAEGLPIGPQLCRARWAVASLAAVLQAAVVMTNTVPVELFLLGAIGTITCILVVLIALSTFDVVSPGSTFSALNAVGMANSILGISLIVVGALAAAYESVHRRSKRENDSRPLTRNLNDLPTPDVPPNSVPSLYSGIPSILGDTELREAADGKYVALEPFEL